MESTQKKKKSVPKVVKDHAWNRWIGDEVAKTKCLCCGLNEIKMNSFHCGHIIAEVNGGKTSVENLRPICASCNLSMGTENMEEFKSRCGFTYAFTQVKDELVSWTPGCLSGPVLPKNVKWQPGTNSLDMNQEMGGRYTYDKEKCIYVLNSSTSPDISNRKFVVLESGRKIYTDTFVH